MPRADRWLVHLGVHKTGTTFLQANLEANRQRLEARGVDVLLPDQLRALDPRPLEGVSWLRSRVRGPTWRDLVEPVAPLLNGRRVVLISEENLLGGPGDVIRGSFYEHRIAAFRAVGRLARRAEVRVVLAIRSLDTFLPSAYSQMLQHAPAPEGGFDRVRARVRRKPPSWAEVVDVARRHLGSAQVVVCTYEDLRGNEEEMLTVLTDGVEMPVRRSEIPGDTRSATWAGIRAAERLRIPMPHDDRVQTVRRLYGSHAGGPPFQPFDDAEVHRLQELYLRDLRAIAAAHPGVLRRLGR